MSLDWTAGVGDHGAPSRPVFFDARLTPYRSLGARGFLWLMVALSSLSALCGLVFWLNGAWPVVGFFGVDVVFIYVVFRANYRAANAYELVTLTDADLTVRRVDAKGGERSWHFEPSWLKVDIVEPPEPDSPLTLASHGRSLQIGAFLTAEERVEVATALRDALRLRRDGLIGAL